MWRSFNLLLISFNLLLLFFLFRCSRTVLRRLAWWCWWSWLSVPGPLWSLRAFLQAWTLGASDVYACTSLYKGYDWTAEHALGFAGLSHTGNGRLPLWCESPKMVRAYASLMWLSEMVRTWDGTPLGWFESTPLMVRVSGDSYASGMVRVYASMMRVSEEGSNLCTYVRLCPNWSVWRQWPAWPTPPCPLAVSPASTGSCPGCVFGCTCSMPADTAGSGARWRLLWTPRVWGGKESFCYKYGLVNALCGTVRHSMCVRAFSVAAINACCRSSLTVSKLPAYG